MKKYGIIVVIVAIVVADLVLSGMNVVLGIMMLLVGLLVALMLDNASRQPKQTTSITKAARDSRLQRAEMTVAA